MENRTIRLSSPAPLEDRLKRFNVIYPVSFLIGVIIGLLFDATWYMMGLTCLIPAWLIKTMFASRQILKLQDMRFEMSGPISVRDMAGKITLPLTQLGMTVTVDNNAAVVTYRSMQYHIITDAEGGFWFLLGPTRKSALLIGDRYITQYNKAIVAIGLIAYTVQKETAAISAAEGSDMK
ncbi:MAG: hypothetical protein VB086_04265 [Clostridiaceae bacterium]|nr:hypothetical protein [Clostridiaceae bacterium]